MENIKESLKVPMVNGWENFHRLTRADFIANLNTIFESDRLARAAGHPAATIPVVDSNPLAQSAVPSPDSYAFFSAWEKKIPWKNETTVRSIESFRAYNPSALIDCIAPTPLLMVVMNNDHVTPPDLALRAYARALEPKELLLLKGGHFEAYDGPKFELIVGKQAEFLRANLSA
jgi:hypothetical protein